jgi:hypothetical protein
MIADVDPITLGEVEIQFNKIFSSKLDSGTAEIVFEPRENRVFLQFRYQFVTYRQYWDAQNRGKFSAAVERFNREFEESTLVDRGTKTRKNYGSFKGLTEWQQFNIGIAFPFRSHPTFQLGYEFKEKIPYLTILQQDAPDETRTNDEVQARSLVIIVYLTRSQAKEVNAFFDQNFLKAQVQ